MHRNDLQIIAQTKLDDATLLLQHGCGSNAYYLAGYAIEIALKACITKRIRAETIPDLAFVKSIYNHNLRDLVKVANLTTQLGLQQQSDSSFAANWAIVCEWGPTERYNVIALDAAELLISSISDRQHGVLPWIKAYW